MPATGPRAPARTLVAVRAIVPVTQMPPNSAEAILATPCATSSQFERWRRPVMPSATTADSRIRSRRAARRRARPAARPETFASENGGRCGAGRSRGMPPKRVPMVSTGRPAAQAATRATRDGDQHARPVRPPASQATIMPIDDGGQRDGARIDRAAAPRRALELGHERRRAPCPQGQAEQVLDLAGEDDDRDAGGEADRHRIGNVLDVGAEPQEARRDQDQARQQRREQQAVDAVPLDGRRDQHDEGARRPADLEPAAAERRDQEAADDRGVKPAVRRHARGDGDRHRQGQRDDRDGQPGDDVRPQRAEPITFAQDRHQLRREELAKARARPGQHNRGFDAHFHSTFV